MTEVRLAAYSPNGARLGPLPTPQDLSASFPLNDVGGLSLNYPEQAARADLLGQPLEVSTEVSTDGGQTWAEPDGGRFLYLVDGRDPVNGSAFQVEAPSYARRLTKALIPFTGLNGDSLREFATVSPGAVFKTLFTEAQARGALTGMTCGATATQDSSGTSWGSLTVSVAYEPGKDLLAVLQDLCDAGYLDWTTRGREVRLYVPESTSGLGPDASVGANPVSLRYGRDLTEAPFRRTWEALANVAMVQGDSQVTTERQNLGAIAPWGRQETFVTASGVTDTGTLAAMGDAALDLTSAERVEWTYGLEFGAAAFLPFRDYAPGTWVLGSPGAVTPARQRVRQVTLTRSANGAMGGNVVLNDRFLEQDIRTQRAIARLTNGATVSGSGSSPMGNDILRPAAPTGLQANSTIYVDGNTARAQVSLDWLDTTTNADGTSLDDLAGYEVWRRAPGGVWGQVATVQGSGWTDSPYVPGSTWEFQVRAYDTVYNRSDFSATASITMAVDTTPPAPPSTPTLSSSKKLVQVSWDGLNNVGAAMDPDVVAVEVHLSQTTGFTPQPAGSTRYATLTRGGVALIADLPVGATYYGRLVAIDSAGNYARGAQSAAVQVMPETDGQAPSAAPTGVTLTPLGIAALQASWTAVTNADLVRYDVHLDDAPGFTTSAATWVGETPGTSLAIDAMPDGTPLTVGAPYYVKVIPRDADGYGPTSSEATGIPVAADAETIAADYVYTGTLSANQIQVGMANADVVLSGKFLTAQTGQRVEISSTGIQWFTAANPTVPSINLPTDPLARAKISGDAELDRVTVRDGVSILKAATSSQALRLEPGANGLITSGVQPPQTGPSVQVSWPGNGFGAPSLTNGNAALSLGVHRGATYTLLCYRGSVWTTGAGWNGRVARFPSAGGGQVDTILPAGYSFNRTSGHVVDVCSDGGTGYYLLWRSDQNDIGEVVRVDANLQNVSWSRMTYGSDFPGQSDPSWSPHGVWSDGTWVYVIGSLRSTQTGASTVAMVTYLISTGAVASTVISSTGVNGDAPDRNITPKFPSSDLGYGLWIGTAAGYGASRIYAPLNRSGSVAVWGWQNVAGMTTDSAANFPAPNNGGQIVGLTYDGSRFWTTVSVNVASGWGLYQHSDLMWTTESATWWVNYAWKRASPVYTTVPGPAAAFTMSKRATVQWSSAAIPNAGGSTDPDQVAFYLGRGGSYPGAGGMFQQGAVGSSTSQTWSSGLVFSGTTAPTAPTFPDGSPGSLASQIQYAGEGQILLRGDGYARLGPLTLSTTGVLDIPHSKVAQQAYWNVVTPYGGGGAYTRSFSVGGPWRCYDMPGVQGPASSRWVYVKVNVRGRSSANAAGYWYLRCGDGGTIVDSYRWHNNGVATRDVDATISGGFALPLNHAAFPIWVEVSVEGTALTVEQGNMALTFVT